MSSNDQIQMRLTEKTDREGDSYYVGSLDMPITVRLDEVSFFVFHPTEGQTHATLMMRKSRPFVPSRHNERKEDWQKSD